MKEDAISRQAESEVRTQMSSADCISRQAVLKLLVAMPPEEATTKAMLIQSVKQMDAVQPEIIRCRDCKYWMPYDWMFSEVWKSKNMEDYPENEIGCAYADMSMSATDFCSRAQRREGNK